MTDPHFQSRLIRLLKACHELARQNRQFDMAQTFKSMARQAGPDDVALVLDEIVTLWQEARRAKVWPLADGIRQELQGLPGLVLDESPGGSIRWRLANP